VDAGDRWAEPYAKPIVDATERLVDKLTEDFHPNRMQIPPSRPGFLRNAAASAGHGVWAVAKGGAAAIIGVTGVVTAASAPVVGVPIGAAMFGTSYHLARSTVESVKAMLVRGETAKVSLRQATSGATAEAVPDTAAEAGGRTRSIRYRARGLVDKVKTDFNPAEMELPPRARDRWKQSIDESSRSDGMKAKLKFGLDAAAYAGHIAWGSAKGMAAAIIGVKGVTTAAAGVSLGPVVGVVGGTVGAAMLKGFYRLGMSTVKEFKAAVESYNIMAVSFQQMRNPQAAAETVTGQAAETGHPTPPPLADARRRRAATTEPETAETARPKAVETTAEQKALIYFMASKGKLACGHGFEEGLSLIANVPAAEAAYAIADIIGASSKDVEEYVDRRLGGGDLSQRGKNPVLDRPIGYVAFNKEVTDIVYKGTQPQGALFEKVQEKSDKIRELSIRHNPESRMLRFARAASALGKEEAPSLYGSFDECNQAPVGYLITGQLDKGYGQTLMPHVIECANTEREIGELDIHISGGAAGTSKFATLLQARADKLGIELRHTASKAPETDQPTPPPRPRTRQRRAATAEESDAA